MECHIYLLLTLQQHYFVLILYFFELREVFVVETVITLIIVFQENILCCCLTVDQINFELFFSFYFFLHILHFSLAERYVKNHRSYSVCCNCNRSLEKLSPSSFQCLNNSFRPRTTLANTAIYEMVLLLAAE